MNTTTSQTSTNDGFRFEAVDTSTFLSSNHLPNWLVEGVLVADQPAVLGGPKKSLKTSLAVDLAISLGSGTRFLGHFNVPRPRKVVFLSGESGETTLQKIAASICNARSITPDGCGVLWQADLPRLWQIDDLGELAAGLEHVKAELVIIDPLYLCLMDGSRAGAAANLYEIGPVLRDAAMACLSVGATPLFVHHAVKQAVTNSGEGRPLDLEQLAFSGIGEYVRQWILINRSSPYQDGSGEHKLVMSIGGSAGHASCWNVTVAEGILRADFGGRRWQVSVSPHGRQTGAPKQAVKAQGRESTMAKFPRM